MGISRTHGIGNALGRVAYAEITADVGSITGTQVDVTGLSVTFTPQPNRRYKITVYGEINSTVANDVPVVALTDGSNTQLKRMTFEIEDASRAYTWSMEFIEASGASPSSITRKVRASRAIGTGTVTIGAAANNPAFILVEDIGPA